jgi:hypothetical protein
MNIYELAEMQDLFLTISYRTRLKDWYCNFEKYSVKDGIMLKGVSGDGKTPDAALKNYIEKIKGQRLVYGVGSEGREFNVPMSLTE